MFFLNILSIIIAIIGRERNKLVISLISGVIMTFINAANGNYIDGFLSFVILFIIYFLSVLVSFFITGKIDPDSIILYVFIWEVIYSVMYFVLSMGIRIIVTSFA